MSQKSQYISEPIAPPHNVTVVNKTSTSITVTWHEVRPGGRRGFILEYKVDYATRATKSNNHTIVEAPTRYLEINNLEKNTNYSITVLAATCKGYGPASEPVVVATDQGN